MSAPTVLQVLHQGGGAGSVTSTLHLSLGWLGGDARAICLPPRVRGRVARTAGGLEVHPLALLPHRRRGNAAALAEVLTGILST